MPKKQAQAAPGGAEAKPPKSRAAQIWSVVSWLLVLAVAALAVALVGVRLLGFEPFAVLSPSMTPTYGVGDLVYAQKTAPEKIEVGDPITFVVDEEGTLVTHRVVEADRENRCFYTQGDANQNRDGAPVLYENVVGVVRFSLPKLGYVSAYLTSPSGRYVGIAAVLTLLLLMILPDLFKPDKPKPDKPRRGQNEGDAPPPAQLATQPEPAPAQEAEPAQEAQPEPTQRRNTP